MYPTTEQVVQLRKTAGCSRYVYNWALDRWKTMYDAVDKGESTEKPSAFKLMTIWTNEKPDWARSLACCAQQRAIMNLGKAYQNLWHGRGKYPKFHKRGSTRDGFYITNQHGRLYGDSIRLPNIGRVKLAEQLRFEGRVMGFNVSTYANQWYVSVEVDVADDPRPSCNNPESVVGIDVGLKHLAVASDGTVLDAPASIDKLNLKLRKAQRALARSQRNSANRDKRLVKKQRIQNKIDNIRKDITHKFTTTIAKNHGTVVVEDLAAQEMRTTASKTLRRSLASSCMTMIINQLEYKAQRLRKVDRYFPSSKRCSECGNVKKELKLSERVYKCDCCGAVLDRDLNAALNLMKSGTVSPVAPVEIRVNPDR